MTFFLLALFFTLTFAGEFDQIVGTWKADCFEEPKVTTSNFYRGVAFFVGEADSNGKYPFATWTYLHGDEASCNDHFAMVTNCDENNWKTVHKFIMLTQVSGLMRIEEEIDTVEPFINDTLFVTAEKPRRMVLEDTDVVFGVLNNMMVSTFNFLYHCDNYTLEVGIWADANNATCYEKEICEAPGPPPCHTHYPNKIHCPDGQPSTKQLFTWDGVAATPQEYSFTTADVYVISPMASESNVCPPGSWNDQLELTTEYIVLKKVSNSSDYRHLVAGTSVVPSPSNSITTSFGIVLIFIALLLLK